MAKFISDDDMAKIEESAPRSKTIISDEEMSKMIADEPSEIQSVLRGIAQGATMGFADEITGGLESLFTDKTYEQARDESRNAYKLAEEANPNSYLAGQLGGGVATAAIPGMGGATLGKLALQGAAQGLGSSEADLLEGDVLGAAKDTAIGAGMGGLAHGAGKALQAGGSLIGKGASKAGNLAAEGVESGANKLLTKFGDVDQGTANMLTGHFGDEGYGAIRSAAAKKAAPELEEAMLKQLAKDNASHLVTPDQMTEGVSHVVSKMGKEVPIGVNDIGMFGGLEYLAPGVGKLYAAKKGFDAVNSAIRTPSTVMKGYRAAERAGALTTEILERIAPHMGKYGKVLADAAQRGGTSVAATDYVLAQQDPEYREAKRKALEMNSEGYDPLDE